MKSSSETCRLSKKVRLELGFAFSALLRSQTFVISLNQMWSVFQEWFVCFPRFSSRSIHHPCLSVSNPVQFPGLQDGRGHLPR